ncbi:MAG: 30S ribosomal protein S1 [Chloroflexota bacterium]
MAEDVKREAEQAQPSPAENGEVAIPETTLSETAPQETTSQETAAQEAAPQENAPQEAAPQESAPQEDVPQEAAPREAAPQEEPSAKPMDEMQSLMDDMERDYRSPQRGHVIEGIVVSVDKDGILVDIGTKSEGIIPSHEIPSALEEGPVEVGDEVLVYVVQPEDKDGHVVLSLKRARTERGWRQVEKRHEENATIEAEIVDANKGGLIVNVNGLRGFVPSSQVVGFRQIAPQGEQEGVDERLQAMVGRNVSLKVLEINRRRNRLILSERAAMQEIRARRKEELLLELEPGQMRHGRISSVCDFGAFVDLGGADGLVHISELAWSPTSHPSEVVQVGQEVDVQVISVDREKKKIALSLRRALPEPWSQVADHFNVGDEVQGRITKLSSFGAFARIADGVEGLIHISELSDERISHPKNVVQEGDVLTLKVIRVEPERRRLGLSLRQATQRQPEEAEAPPVEPPASEPEEVATPVVETEEPAADEGLDDLNELGEEQEERQP